MCPGNRPTGSDRRRRASRGATAAILAGFCLASVGAAPADEPGNTVAVGVSTIKGTKAGVRATASGEVAVPPHILWKLIDDCGNYTRTMLKIKKSQEIARNGGTVTCTTTADMPLFFDDLDSVTEAEHTLGPPAWKRSWHLVRGDFRRNDGFWQVESIEGKPGASLLSYQIEIEPKVALPGWLMRAIQKNVMKDTLPKLFARIEDLAPALYGGGPPPPPDDGAAGGYVGPPRGRRD